VDIATGEFVARRVIDSNDILSAYNCVYEDINGDGIPELIVNNHEEDDDLNGIFMYEFPEDWMTGNFD